MEINALKCGQAEGRAPATSQQVTDDQAKEWQNQWGFGLNIPPPVWPEEMGEALPELLKEELLDSALTFSNHTGLGWDRLHPKCISRLSDSLLMLLMTILRLCEDDGGWPAMVALVIIALLPKAEGGFRPIGLVPFLPRLWMRARRRIAKAWEETQQRQYLYAGRGKGANVAAWKQAMTAQLAATQMNEVEYASAYLDLVKAFDRVPLWLLIREAIALRYPLILLRLLVATYLLQRVLRIGKVVSYTLVAWRGITAGSGFATTEMRLILIRCIDAALILYPQVTPTLFVDDLAADMTAPTKHLMGKLGGFIEYVAKFIGETQQELSKVKSFCSASCREVGEKLCRRWAVSGIIIKYVNKVKALGVGLGAGRRRNMKVVRSRLVAYSKRIPGFRRLR